MIIDVPDRIRPHLADAARKRAAELRRAGLDTSAGMLDALADALLPLAADIAAADPLARIREQRKEATRRWRARQRGEDVPKRRPGTRPKAA